MPNFVAMHRLVAAAGQRPAEELFALRAAVDVGRVEEGDAGIERRVDHARRRGLVDPHAEVVAAEADDGDLERADRRVSIGRDRAADRSASYMGGLQRDAMSCPPNLPHRPPAGDRATVQPRSSRGARRRPWRPDSAGCSRGWRASNSTTRCRRPACRGDRAARTVRALAAGRRCRRLARALPVRVARVVAARVIRGVRVRAAVRLRAGEDVVLVRHVADAVDDRLLLAQRQLLPERVAHTGLLDRVAVELGDALRDALSAGVEPRPVADAVTRVDRARTLRAQVGVPHHRRAAAGRRAQLLAVRVGAGQPAVVGAVALGDARDEERHRLRRGAASATLSAAAAGAGGCCAMAMYEPRTSATDRAMRTARKFFIRVSRCVVRPAGSRSRIERDLTRNQAGF